MASQGTPPLRITDYRDFRLQNVASPPVDDQQERFLIAMAAAEEGSMTHPHQAPPAALTARVTLGHIQDSPRCTRLAKRIQEVLGSIPEEGRRIPPRTRPRLDLDAPDGFCNPPVRNRLQQSIRHLGDDQLIGDDENSAQKLANRCCQAILNVVKEDSSFFVQRDLTENLKQKLTKILANAPKKIHTRVVELCFESLNKKLKLLDSIVWNYSGELTELLNASMPTHEDGSQTQEIDLTFEEWVDAHANSSPLPDADLEDPQDGLIAASANSSSLPGTNASAPYPFLRIMLPGGPQGNARFYTIEPQKPVQGSLESSTSCDIRLTGETKHAWGEEKKVDSRLDDLKAASRSESPIFVDLDDEALKMFAHDESKKITDTSSQNALPSTRVSQTETRPANTQPQEARKPADIKEEDLDMFAE